MLAAPAGGGVAGASSGAGAVWIGTGIMVGAAIVGAGCAGAADRFGATARLWWVVVVSVFATGEGVFSVAAGGTTSVAVVGAGIPTLAAVVGAWSAGVTPMGVGGVIASEAPVSTDEDVVVLASFGLWL